jgi:hypothetical protein
MLRPCDMLRPHICVYATSVHSVHIIFDEEITLRWIQAASTRSLTQHTYNEHTHTTGRVRHELLRPAPREASIAVALSPGNPKPCEATLML